MRAFWTTPNAAGLAVDCQKSRNSSTLKTLSHFKNLADFHLDFLLEVPVRIPSLPACNMGGVNLNHFLNVEYLQSI